jgi:ATPase subunit of ABC transporter with duplicated ATPase domains
MSAPGDLRVSDFVELIDAVGIHEGDTGDLQKIFPAAPDLRRSFGSLSTGEAKRLLLWGLLRANRGPLVLDEPYEHLSRDAKAALTDILRARAERNTVVVATNQDVPERAGDDILLLEDDRIEVRHVI